jgi:hypothetical protein
MLRYSIFFEYDSWAHFFNLWDQGKFEHIKVTGSPTGDGVFCEDLYLVPEHTRHQRWHWVFPYSVSAWRYLASLTRHLCLLIWPVTWVLLLQWRKQCSQVTVFNGFMGTQTCLGEKGTSSTLIRETSTANNWVTRTFRLFQTWARIGNGLCISLPNTICCVCNTLHSWNGGTSPFWHKWALVLYCSCKTMILTRREHRTHTLFCIYDFQLVG